MHANLQKAFKAISPNQRFVHFDLGLDDSVMRDFESLAIECEDDFNHFGSDKGLVSGVQHYFEKLGNKSAFSRHLAQQVKLISCNALDALHHEALWLTLRSSKPTTYFDTPRWHTDGYFYDQIPENKQCKIAFGLKGSRTLFNSLNNDPVMTAHFHDIERDNDMSFEEKRTALNALVDFENTQCAARGQGSVFGVGDSFLAAVHSEPKIHEDRLFGSIVTGSSQQIEALRVSWGL